MTTTFAEENATAARLRTAPVTHYRTADVDGVSLF